MPPKTTETEPLLYSQRDNAATQGSAVQEPATRADEVGQPAPPGEIEYTTGQLIRTFGGVYLSAILAALDGTLVATIIPQISSNFESGTSFVWLASAYFIANAASQPVAGRLSDIYGRRTCLIAANLIFCLGNLVCGLAQSQWIVIAGRAIAGIGGGAIGPIATSHITDTVSLRRRGPWYGAANICYAAGSSLGGPLGGWISDRIGWRWAFAPQAPITIIAVIVIYLFQGYGPAAPTHSQRREGVAKYKRVDFLGVITLVSALILLLLGLSAGGNIVPWTHPIALVTLPLAFAILATFIWIELYFAREPIIPIPLLGDRTVLAGCIANWLASAAKFGLIFYVPVFFRLQSLSDAAIGLLLIPDSVSIGLSSFLLGFTMKRTGKYYWLGIAASTMACAGVRLSYLFQTPSMAALPIASLALSGAGYSGIVTITAVSMNAAVDQEHQAIVNSISYAFRSTGTIMGITLASTIYQNSVQVELRRRLQDLPDSRKIIQKLRDNPKAIDILPVKWVSTAREAFVTASHHVSVALFCLALLYIAAMGFLKEYKLHSKIDRRD